MRKILSIVTAMLVALAVNAVETPVNPGSGTLKAAVDAAAAGDVLVLADGVYSEPEVIDLNKDLTIQAAEDAHPVVAQQYYMKLLNSAKVTFIGIKFDGGLYNDGQGANDHCIRAYDATAGKTLTVIDCEFCNWKSYILYPQRADRCADALTIRNCYFHDNKRCAVFTENVAGALGALTIENSTFANFTEVSEALIAVKNGGTEEANQAIRVDHCTFYNYVKNSTGDYSFIDVRKSTDVVISNCIFAQPEEGMSKATYCYGGEIDNCLIFNTTGHRSGNCVVSNGIEADPLFVDATNGDYTLGEGSPALTAATDGGAIGDPRWVPSAEPALPYMAIIGDMNNWAGDELVPAEDKLTASATIHLDMNANSGYGFKILIGDKAYCIEPGAEWYSFHRGWTSVSGIDHVAADDEAFWLSIDKEGDYTFIWTIEEKKIEIIFPELENITYYFVNTPDWENVYAYAWDPEIAGWPGEAAAPQLGVSKNGHNVWAYTMPENRRHIIFNDGAGGEGHQTANLDVEDGKPYFYDGTWYATLDEIPTEGGEGIHNAAVEAKAVKMMENGQLVIIKNGVKYNVLGTAL